MMSLFGFLSVHFLLLTSGFELERFFGQSGSNADYGEVISTYETTMVVGAPGDGLVYVYELNTDTNSWDEIQIIDDTEDGQFDEFGRDVSIYNNSMVILADYNQPFYFYERLNDSSNKWIEIARFSTNLFYPTSVAISNNYAVFGDSWCSNFDITSGQGGGGGCMHIYKKNKIFDGNKLVSNWTYLETRQPSDVVAYAYFGESIDIWDDKYIVSGADGARDYYGQGYVFEIIEYDDGIVNITEIDIIIPNDTDHYNFGSKVDIFDNTIAISAYGSPQYLYVFERDENTGKFIQVNRLDGFSTSINELDIYNNYMIVGANSFSISEAHIFHRFHPNQTWSQVAYIPQPNTSDSSADFGSAVAITQDFAFIGAYDELNSSSTSIRVGAVYIVSDFKPNYLSNPPTTQPSHQPSAQPSLAPSFQPTTQPSRLPSSIPSTAPTSLPSIVPTLVPSIEPTANDQLTGDDDDGDDSIEQPLSNTEEGTPTPTVFIFEGDDNDEVQLILIGAIVLLFATNIGTCIYFKRRQYYDDEEYDDEEYDDEYDGEEDDRKDNTTDGIKQASMGSDPLGVTTDTIIEEDEDGGGNGNTTEINPLTGKPYLPKAPMEVALEIDGMPVTGGADPNTGSYEYNDEYESASDDANGGGNGMGKTAGNTRDESFSKDGDNDANETGYKSKNGEEDQVIEMNTLAVGNNPQLAPVYSNSINNIDNGNSSVDNNNVVFTRNGDESGEDSDSDVVNDVTTGK